MSGSANLRFLFDTDFREPATPSVPEPEAAFEPNVDEERATRERIQAEAVAQAEQVGYARGREEAERAAAEREDARLNLLLERLNAQVGAAAADIQARMAGLETAAAHLGVEAARKLAPALVASQPETEIAAFFARALKDFIEAPTLDVHLNDEDVAKAGGLLRKLAAAGGYEGRIRVRPNESLARGDCVVSWGEGGTRREMATIDAELRTMLADHFEWGNEGS